MMMMRLLQRVMITAVTTILRSSISRSRILLIITIMVSTTSGFMTIPSPSSSSNDILSSSSLETTTKRRRSRTELYYTPRHSIDSSIIRFLGKGPNALVRPGVVLIAPPDVYDHYLMKSALYVYAMGMDGDTDEEVVRCVVLDNPTPFTMNEMMNQGATSSGIGEIGENLLYRGGNVGGDSAIMLHNVTSLQREEIGTSGIYEGGLNAAVSSGDYDVDRFKFFFNYCEFSPQELTIILDEQIDSETGEAWMSVEVPTQVVLHDWDKNDCWKYLRRIIKLRFKSSMSSSTTTVVNTNDNIEDLPDDDIYDEGEDTPPPPQ